MMGQVEQIADQIVAAAAPAFQPRNRSGRGNLGKVAFEVDGVQWFVDDIQYDDSDYVWASPASGWRMSIHYQRSVAKFILINDRGGFLKHPARPGEGKGRTRYFKSREAAAQYAQENPL